MNVLNLLTQNFSHGSRTRKPADAVQYPTGYRGQIQHTLDLCTACGTCVYTCSPRAIQIDENDPNVSVWQYREDRCTFCGYCVTYCPTHALSFKEEAPAPLSERSQHYLTHAIQLLTCRECGQPYHSLPQSTMFELYGDPLPPEFEAARGLCERCRQRLNGQRFLNAMAPKRGEHAG
jgi:formate hydrogenlyase subunit 6/NADH:ubiquinone oxidoreductase subunit I